MTEPDSTDWQAIGEAYCAGPGTVRGIAASHGVSEAQVRGRARRAGWRRPKRNGAAVVQTEPEHTTGPTTRPSDDIVREHRREIAELRELVTLVQVDLRRLLAGEETTTPDLLGGRDSVIDAIDKLSRALDRLISLERRAFHLDDPLRGRLTIDLVDAEIARLEADLADAAT